MDEAVLQAKFDTGEEEEEKNPNDLKNLTNKNLTPFGQNNFNDLLKKMNVESDTNDRSMRSVLDNSYV